jgi:cell wall-associated NlpC family hydrolase
MQQQVQAAIDSVAAKYSEKRTGLFQIQAQYQDGVIALSGRTLEKASLADLRRAIEARIAKPQIDESAVQVLRRETAVRKIVATNVTDLHTEPSFLSELLTQILNGQSLEILEERGDWCYVRQDDGYLGWVYASYLQGVEEGAADAEYWVTAPAARLLDEPRTEAGIGTCLLCGTAVHVEEMRAKWAYVNPVGASLPAGWMPSADLRRIAPATAPSDIAQQIIADARRLIGVYYLWGGATPFGLDCSALAQLTHRINGVTLPRDAYMQFTVGKAVEPPFKPGDLVYFHSDSDKQRITHVGICLGGWDIIHSSRNKNGVYEENVQSNPRLKGTIAGGRTFLR